jgi:hypothetical protein
LTLLAVGLVPIAVLSFRLGDANREALETQVLKTHVVVARAAASRAEALLEGQRAAAQSVASNPSFYLDPTSAAGGELLAGLLQALPDVTAAVALSPTGQEVVRAQRRGAGQEVDALLAAANKALVELVAAAGQSWLVLRLPLAEERGFLMLLSPATVLAGVVEVPEFEQEAELVLLTEDLRLVAGSEQSMQRFPQGFLRQAAAGEVRGAQRDIESEGQHFLGAFSPLEIAPWFVASLQPSEFAEQTLRQLRRQTWIAILAAALLTTALSVVAYRSLVRPVRRLLSAQRKLAGLEAEQGKDELSLLRETFDLLERRIRDKEALGEVFLGRYEVTEVLGEGAMGTVFRGWDPRLKRQVALKTVKFGDSHLSAEKKNELFERLEHEAVLGARIRHENIVAVYDLIRAGDLGFLAMEFVDGQPLSAYLWREGGTLPPGEVVYLATAIARGLSAAHKHKIVHHDIKPANVLLGYDGAVKLADFGIGRFMTSVMGKESERLFGTPGYLPPETLRGQGYTPRSDLFALGCVMHELLTGELPVMGHSVRELIVNTLAGPQGRRQDAWQEVPEDLRPLMNRLLDPDPEQRPFTADEVVHELLALKQYWSHGWVPNLTGGSGNGKQRVSLTRHAQLLKAVAS